MVAVSFQLHDEYNLERYKGVAELRVVADFVLSRQNATSQILLRTFYHEVANVEDGPGWLQRRAILRGLDTSSKQLAQHLQALCEYVMRTASAEMPAPKVFAHVRGILLELIVERQLRKRYGSRTYTNSIVILEGVPVQCHGQNHPRTVDVAGWDHQVSDGEFVECKTSCHRLFGEDYPKLLYLEHLQKCLLNKHSAGIVVIVSMENDYDIKHRLSKRRRDNPYVPGLVGSQNVFRIGEEKIRVS